MMLRWLLFAISIVVVAGIIWGALHFVQMASLTAPPEIPTTPVKRGRVTIAVSARGELQGGNSEVLTAPMAGGGDLVITYLRTPGEQVDKDDVVVQFDPTQLEYNVREAEADLAEAQEQVNKAQADAEAGLEEARYQVLAAASDVKQAELEVRKNPVLAGVIARQNEISLEAARNRLQQAQKDFENKKATIDSGVAIQRAGVEKARAIAATSQRMMDGMTLRAKTAGYVNVQTNSNQNVLYYGQELPLFQEGDGARAGQAVAQIPDLANWEVIARIPEADRGHVAPGQSVSIQAAALPGREFKGRISSLGASSGAAWDRSFECRIALEDAAPELRPGMSANVRIMAGELDNVLWIPSQALFGGDGRSFVYVRTAQGFTTKDVQLVKRTESQAVITGVEEGELVALSRPDQADAAPPSGKAEGALKALETK